MRKHELKQLRKIIEQLTGRNLNGLSLGDGPDEIEGWDSVTHINLVLALEARYGVSFTDEEIGELMSIGLIVETLKEKGVSENDL